MDGVDPYLIGSSLLGGYLVYWIYCTYDTKKENYNLHAGAGLGTAALLYTAQIRFPYVPDLSRKVLGSGQ
jgi:hypothetical protein